MPLIVQTAQHSDLRLNTQQGDALGIHLPHGQGRAGRTFMACLADGVSVATHGDQAASIAVHSFCADFFSTDPHWSTKTAGYRVIEGIHRWLAGQRPHDVQHADHSHLTRFCAVVIQGEFAHLFYVGGVHVWRLRQQHLECLTHDHVIRGTHNDQLTRALGMQGRIQVDYSQVDVRAGDRFLLSTHGLHNCLKTAKLNDILQTPDLADCLTQLFKTANDSQSNCQGNGQNNSKHNALMFDIQQLDVSPNHSQTSEHLPLLPDLLSAGQRVDGYRIVRQLHASARSTVYQAQRESDGVHVVLKAPSPQLVHDIEALQAFMREGWIGQHIQHPDVVQTFAPDPNRKYLYLVQAYLSGCNMRVWRQQYPDVPVQTLIAMMRPIVQALRALHRRETLHQDIKPDNMMVLDDGRVTLIDLGSARVGSLHDGRSRPGAYEYAAPEYALGQPVDARADQFALAVSLYELLTGHLPYGKNYANANTPSLFAALYYIPARQYNPHVPDWIDAALMRAAHRDVNQRYTDLGAFMADLERPNLSLSRPQRPRTQQSPVRFWQVTSALLLLGHLVWLIIWVKL